MFTGIAICAGIPRDGSIRRLYIGSSARFSHYFHEDLYVSQEKTEAHVLRGVDFSETSRIVTFLSPERGRLTCIAKGVRRKNSMLASVLDTMNRVELIYYWKDGRSVQTLAEASLLDAYPSAKGDLERGAFAAFPLEIASKVAHENEPSRDFYAALSRGLDGLEAWRGDARAHCCWQVALLLAAAGFTPELDRCVHCGRKIGDNPGFDSASGAVCGACRAERRIPPAALADLRALFAGTGTCPEMQVSPEVFRLLRGFTIRQTESDYRSLRVLDDMFG